MQAISHESFGLGIEITMKLNCQIKSNKICFYTAFGRYFSPWIRIWFLWFRIQGAKMLRIQRILILSAGINLYLCLDPGIFPVMYERPLVRDNTRSSSFSSGAKRSTKPVQQHQQQHQQQQGRYVKKEVTQLSPVKKRIKENKDHYIGELSILLCHLYNVRRFFYEKKNIYP